MESFGGEDSSVVAPLNQWRHDASRIFQYYLDRITPLPYYRWLGTIILAAIYVLRVYYVQGFYVVSYGLGIYILNLLIGFLSPLVDPEMGNSEEALLPMKGSDEFKPFIRRLPEFKFWYLNISVFNCHYLYMDLFFRSSRSQAFADLNYFLLKNLFLTLVTI